MLISFTPDKKKKLEVVIILYTLLKFRRTVTLADKIPAGKLWQL